MTRQDPSQECWTRCSSLASGSPQHASESRASKTTAAADPRVFALQASSHNESTSTLQFGARVSEITLGQAKKNVESGLMLDAKEASAKLQRETAAAR